MNIFVAIKHVYVISTHIVLNYVHFFKLSKALCIILYAFNNWYMLK